MHLLRILLVLTIALTMGAAPASAARGRISSARQHQAWTSCILSVKGGTTARLFSLAQNDREVTLALDFVAEGGAAMTILVGKREARGKRILKNGPYEKNVQLRVDREDIFHARAHISEDANNVYVFIGAGELQAFFVEQMKRGENLRIMVFDAEEGVPRFSLRGFTAALARGMDLLQGMRGGNGDDRSYFHERRSPGMGNEAPRMPAPRSGTRYF